MVKVPSTYSICQFICPAAPTPAAINELDAAERLTSYSFGAHKAPEKLSQLLVCSHTFQLAKQHRQMMLALNSFHAIGMEDIETGLRGPEIGAALRQARIDHLDTQHPS